ncbi:MAG: hypothetical protein ACREX7_09295 [Casimicrobiaceae bacterium]
MTRLLLISLAALMLGGCVVVPFDAYYDGHHHRGDGYWQRDYGHEHDFRYHGDRD